MGRKSWSRNGPRKLLSLLRLWLSRRRAQVGILFGLRAFSCEVCGGERVSSEQELCPRLGLRSTSALRWDANGEAEPSETEPGRCIPVLFCTFAILPLTGNGDVERQRD